MLSEEDCFYTEDPVCPYCGWRDRDFRHEGLKIGSRGLELECEDCEKEFRVNAHLSTRFSTSPILGWPEL